MHHTTSQWYVSAQNGLRKSISGVGTGAKIRGPATNTIGIYCASTQSIKSIIIDTGIKFNGGMVHMPTRYVSLTGCTVAADSRNAYNAGVFSCTNVIMNNCVLSSPTGCYYANGDGVFYRLTGTTVTHGFFQSSIYGSTITNCKFNCDTWYLWLQSKVILDGGQSSANFNYKTNYGGQVLVFKNNVKFTGYINTDNGTDARTGVACIISGSTVDLTGNGYNRPIMAPATVKVGTFDNLDKVSDGTAVWTTGGTATIITATGATVKVSGEGTYINKDGTTDLTVVS